MFFFSNETKEENIRKTKHLIYLSIQYTIIEGEGLRFVYVLYQNLPVSTYQDH